MLGLLRGRHCVSDMGSRPRKSDKLFKSIDEIRRADFWLWILDRILVCDRRWGDLER